MPATQDELALARQAGRLEAEVFDRRLREVEQREREERLGLLAWENGAEGLERQHPASQCLEQDVARLAAFHQAVLRSRAWRLVQWARRPLGRAW